MELIYLWVENYNDIIIKQEFSFSNKYTVEKDLIMGVIDIKEKFDVHNIFGNKEECVVQNIVGIIGENGVGKSSILNIILENKHNGFAIFKIKEIEKFNNREFLILCSDNINIRESENYCLMKYNINYTTQWSTGFLVEKSEKDIYLKTQDKPHIIYYDNIFNPYKTYKDINRTLYDWHKENKDLIDIDISTNYYFFHKNNGDKLKYVSNEIKNTIHYFGSDIYDENSLQKPNRLIIKSVDTELFKKEVYEKFDYESFEKRMIKNVVYLFFQQYITTNMEKPYGQYDKVIFDDLINAFCDSEEHVKSYIREKFGQRENGDMPDSFRIFSFDGADHPTPSIKNYIEIINGLKKINLKDISTIVKNQRDNSLHLEVPLNNESIKKIAEFLSIVKENSIKKHFLDYSYDIDYSSGERGLLTLFTRLYVKYKEIENTGQENVLLLLDEPDILYHPEWQRKFIYNLSNFLNKIYKNKKVKVIVTSHSPFIASDLPKENVIMLEKSKDGKCVVKDNKIDTFGANIFDLYSKAFFVESSFGEFAKEKIQGIVKKIEEKKYYENKEEIDFIVNSIGEPLIKNKLLNMIKENQSKEDRINELEQELKRLRGEN